MTIILIILGVAAVIYLYAAVAFYYGYKNWVPFCGCAGTACSPRTPSEQKPEAAGQET
jgi:hypothetical protein